MATSTTIIDGVLEDALANPIANEYIYFKLKQAGADNDVAPTTVYARGFIEGITNASGEIKASDGTSDLVLWVNGESDIQSVYEITTKGGKIEPTQVIIPVSASGSNIAIGELLINHVVSGSSTQQSTVLGDANAYTDALANDPSTNVSFSAVNWRADLNVEDGATADQTGAEIKALYEAEADTNAFTDADEARLDGIISGSGGGQIGTNSSASAGGAIGVSSSETSGGGAVGYFTSTTTGGAVGFFTNSTTGGAVGYLANTTTGGAVGASTISLDGFSGGDSAVSSAAGAVQLGQGTNATASTIQFRSSGSITETQFGKLSDFGDKDTETTITDDDTKIPTSGAVVDHLANKPITTTTPVSTTTYTVTSSDRTVLVDDDTAGADVTITLPSAVTVGDGWSVRVKKEGSTGDVTIDPNGAETIDGNANMVLQHKNQATSLISDGTNWCRLYPTTPNGWAYYKDATYTTSSRLSIGSDTKLEIDGSEGTTNTTFLPDGVSAFWDTTNNKMLAQRVGDSFDVRIAFTVEVSNATDTIKVVLDIGGGATPTIPIVTQYLQFTGPGEQEITFSFPVFTLSTFLTNGGQIFLTKSGGTVEVWGASIMIKRDFSPL